MVPTKTLLGILAALLLISGVAYGVERYIHAEPSYPEAPKIAADHPSFDELTKRFGDLAKAKGAEYAFGVLRHATLPPNTDIHLLAHAIGHVLYAQQGIDGMKICTQEFRNGCSHSLVIDAMQQLGDGDDVRALIDKACKKAPGGTSAYGMCYHGLGHGVFAYYGYSFPKTVEFCMKTGTKEFNFQQAHECIGGAAMELVSGGGHDRALWLEANKKYFSPTDPLAPCDTSLIPEGAKSMCYVYLSPRYMSFVGGSFESFTSDQLTRGMHVCTAIPPGDQRNGCIGSFGKDFANLVGGHDVRLLDTGNYSDKQLRDVETLCKHTPGEQDVHVCESYALSTFFWGGDAEPTLAVRFCSILSDDASRASCFHYLAKDIAQYIPDIGNRYARCAALPDAFRATCRNTGP